MSDRHIVVCSMSSWEIIFYSYDYYGTRSNKFLVSFIYVFRGPCVLREKFTIMKNNVEFYSVLFIPWTVSVCKFTITICHYHYNLFIKIKVLDKCDMFLTTFRGMFKCHVMLYKWNFYIRKYFPNILVTVQLYTVLRVSYSG